jgi:hypothetical protein
MHPGHRMAAERALRALLIGATFVGAHWYGTLDSVLARPHDGPDGKPYDIAYDEIHLFIEAPFALFSARPITIVGAGIKVLRAER